MSQFSSQGYVALSIYASLNQTCGDTVVSQSSCNPALGHTYNFNYTVGVPFRHAPDATHPCSS